MKTIQVCLGFAMVGHIIIIVSAVPPVIVQAQNALGCFIVGLVIFGTGSGGFKYVPFPSSLNSY